CLVELLLSRARLLFDPRGKVNTFLLESTTFKDQNVALRFGIYKKIIFSATKASIRHTIYTLLRSFTTHDTITSEILLYFCTD
ncbi:hypothetical protein, partial [Bacteroides caecigallinarum]|uniref:hypothetical protein n=1 Tax=Bacteroides caecigallinarum TaxID=1411144 RepID=UPI001F375864